MNSPVFPTSTQVLSDLGDSFMNAFIRAVDGAREDYAAFRAWHPDWFAGFTSRFTANYLHERIWDRLARAVDGMEGISVIDREPIRELYSGTTYLIRIKRHHKGDKVSAYPTDAAIAFWSNRALTLDGLGSFSLALGYYWDADLRDLGEAVLSFRDGKDNPIWAVVLRSDSASATGFSWAPLAPELPEIDLSATLGEVREETGS
jgi:hypothetical protein